MPRKSLAALVSDFDVTGRPPRVKPPAGMTTRARLIYLDTVNGLASDHFAPSDIPLLRQFAVACELAEIAEAQLVKDGHVIDGRASPWLTVQEKAHRAQTALSLRLRVCPQSRISKYKDTSSARNRGSREWAAPMEIADDE